MADKINFQSDNFLEYIFTEHNWRFEDRNTRDIAENTVFYLANVITDKEVLIDAISSCLSVNADEIRGFIFTETNGKFFDELKNLAPWLRDADLNEVKSKIKIDENTEVTGVWRSINDFGTDKLEELAAEKDGNDENSLMYSAIATVDKKEFGRRIIRHDYNRYLVLKCGTVLRFSSDIRETETQ